MTAAIYVAYLIASIVIAMRCIASIIAAGYVANIVTNVIVYM